ncbi:MAG: hypothetical protein LBL24_02425 [Bacteroidales bacterium]|jgi:hypothetical protein|nr:hypothetical protein [Bacteroidales bacterium]
MNNRLKEILNTINGFYLYDDDMAHKYMSLINEAIEILRGIEAPPTSMLDDAKNDAITELCNELASRMDEGFFHAPPDRKKSEFKISKMLVGVFIGNVLSNMPPVE